MKKIITLFLTVALCLTLCALLGGCAGTDAPENPDDPSEDDKVAPGIRVTEEEWNAMFAAENFKNYTQEKLSNVDDGKEVRVFGGVVNISYPKIIAKCTEGRTYMLSYAADGTLFYAGESAKIIVSEDEAQEGVESSQVPLKFSDFTYDEASGAYVSSDTTKYSEYDYRGYYDGAEVRIDVSNTKRKFQVTVGADKKLATVSYEEETTQAVRGREEKESVRYTTKTTIFLYDYGTTEITEKSGVERDKWDAATSEDNYRNVTITLTTTTDGGKTSEKQVWKASDEGILVENQEGTQKYVGEEARSDFDEKYKESIGNLRNIVSKGYPWSYVYNPYEDVYQLGWSMSGYGGKIDGRLTNAIKDSQRVDGVNVQSVISDVRITLGENGLLEKVTYTKRQAEEGTDLSTAPAYEYVWEFSDYGTTVVEEE